MAGTSFFQKPNALGWMNYYANQNTPDAQPTMSSFGAATGTPAPAAPGATPPLAGQSIWADIQNQFPPGMFEGVNKDNWFPQVMKLNMLQAAYENHPEVVKQKGRIYADIMNEMADKAQARAIQGHLFAGVLGLGDKLRKAEREKLAYLPEIATVTARGSGAGSPFQPRQYITSV